MRKQPTSLYSEKWNITEIKGFAKKNSLLDVNYHDCVKGESHFKAFHLFILIDVPVIYCPVFYYQAFKNPFWLFLSIFFMD